MRARDPDVQSYVDRDGVKIGYEVFGDGEPTILLMPTWQIVQSRMWKAQVPYLARHFRVITFDARGTGRSDRPVDAVAYSHEEQVADAVGVLDATKTDEAIVVALCSGNNWAVELCARHPGRVIGLMAVAGGIASLHPPHAVRIEPFARFDEVLESHEGWFRYNRDYWQSHFEDFARFFFGQLFIEPHSTKQIEDAVQWAMENEPEVLLAAHDGAEADPTTIEGWIRDISCPVLVINGSDDRCQPAGRSDRLAELTGGSQITLEGAGHLPQAREPVAFNLALRDFADRVAAGPPSKRRWTRSLDRRKRVLYLSSPIGLGHARRDLAIARALREHDPGIQIDWLAQEPVTTFLTAAGEQVHPASAALAGEAPHIQSEAGEHDLHAFQAIRRMDEILVANFMVFHDLVADEPYDLWVGDEAWEVDYFLHENPELKRAPYAWMTDFVGWLPMPDGGDHEAFLAADYNAEMVEHIARFPRLRDVSVFVGGPDDIVPDGLGPGLPGIREWTEQHYEFAGYITGFGPDEFADRDALRARLGYGEDEKVCVVSVGGSGVGEHLLQRVVAAYPQAKDRVPDLRMVVVTGPRIDPASITPQPGLDVRGFLPDLHLHHAACDLGVVQGGLTTTMELTAAQRPFLYFPLAHHFEQNFHVTHRLDRHGAGRRMDYASADSTTIADAIAEEVGRPVAYRDVGADGAKRAAAHLAALI